MADRTGRVRRTRTATFHAWLGQCPALVAATVRKTR